MSVKIRETYLRLIKSKWFCIALIMLLMGLPSYWFWSNRYVGATQDFEPDLSSLGGANPFPQVTPRLQCSSQDGSYLSDQSDIHCQVLARSKGTLESSPMVFHLLIFNSNNQTVFDCNSTVPNVTSLWESGGFCLDSMGQQYFELQTGDYRVIIKQFSAVGAVSVTVTKATPVRFRGELHVISGFEKQTRLSQDGASLAIFFTFLFIIPTTLLAIRSSLYEGASSNRSNVQSGRITSRNSPTVGGVFCVIGSACAVLLALELLRRQAKH